MKTARTLLSVTLLALLLVLATVSCNSPLNPFFRPDTFSVVYNAGNATAGSPPVDANAYEAGEAVTVAGNTGSLSLEHHSFAGWNTAPDGSGTAYGAGSTFIMPDADVLLFAQWTADPTYSVTYDGNGHTDGTVPEDTNLYHAEDTVTVLGPGTMSRHGWSFIGWSIVGESSGTTYNQGDSFTIGTADAVLLAGWTQLSTYTVSYDGTDATAGEPPEDSTNYVEGDVVTVLSPDGLVRDGCTFLGWAIVGDASGTLYQGGDSFLMAAADVTLRAEWTDLPTYSVSYDGNEANSGTVPSEQTKVHGIDLVLASNTGDLERDGFEFSGWNTESDGNGTSYAEGAVYSNDSDLVLFASWDELHTVIYRANDYPFDYGVPPAPHVGVSDGSYIIVRSPSGLERTGWAFVSWNSAADGSGVDYSPGSQLLCDGAVTELWAQWTPDTAEHISTWLVEDGSLSFSMRGYVANSRVDFQIDWGDGTTEVATWANFGNELTMEHPYATNGLKTITMTGVFPGYWDIHQLVSVERWGPMSFTIDDVYFGDFAPLLEDLGSDDWPDISALHSLNHVFQNVDDVWAETLGMWDVSNVTSMVRTFYGASRLYADLSNWDTSNVGTMSGMFAQSMSGYIYGIGNWNTSNVTDMSYMFGGASSVGDLLQGIGSWDVSAVQDMSAMFVSTSCRSIDADISGWDVSSVTDMNRMFDGCGFDQDISGWNIANVTDMTDMFDGVTLSTDTYDAMLVAWEALEVQDGVTFDAGWSKYSAGAPAEARQRLIDEHGWTIYDLGQAP